MDKNEAKIRFADELKIACPVCDAEKDELCKSRGVWIHLERFLEAEKIQNQKQVVLENILLVSCPNCDAPAGRLCGESASWVHMERISASLEA